MRRGQCGRPWLLPRLLTRAAAVPWSCCCWCSCSAGGVLGSDAAVGVPLDLINGTAVFIMGTWRAIASTLLLHYEVHWRTHREHCLHSPTLLVLLLLLLLALQSCGCRGWGPSRRAWASSRWAQHIPLQPFTLPTHSLIHLSRLSPCAALVSSFPAPPFLRQRPHPLRRSAACCSSCSPPSSPPTSSW